MKKNIKISIVGICCMLMISCNDFLTKIPYNSQAIENSYETPNDIKMAVNGCYNQLVEIKKSKELFLNENRSDNATYPNTINVAYYDDIEPSLLVVNPANDNVLPIWRTCYVLISRTNLVLKHINVVINEDDRKAYEAQVKFLRGWAYFTLARYFGGVPIVLEPISSGDDAKQISRASLEDTFIQIEKDLKSSYQLFETLSNYKPAYGQVQQWAAKALLGKVYMTWHKNDLAFPLLNDVYEHSGYILTKNYEDLFVSSLETSKGKEEVLFPIRFISGGYGLGNTFSTLCGYTDISDYGKNTVFWSNSLFNAFVATTDTINDRRYPVTCGEIDGVEAAGQDYFRRYPPKMVGLAQSGSSYTIAKLTKENDGDLDWPELRFADVILLLAEIYADPNSEYHNQSLALARINEVRDRAHAPLFEEHDIQTLFGGNMQEAVQNERRLELAFENHRFFDMIRQGEQYTTSILLDFYKTEPAYDEYAYPFVYGLVRQVIYGDKIDTWRLLLPIPNDEILRNSSIKQNPGYNG